MDRNAPDLLALRVMLSDQSWSKLEAAVEGAERARVEAEGIHHYIRTHHLSESDRLLLTLAYGLWRGFGPTVDIHALWGMDTGVAAKMLAGLAAAIDPERGSEILRHSAELLDALEERDDKVSAPPVDDGARPILAVARE
jgi:hypothetical protein